MQNVVLFAAVGPNPAPVSEAIWALYRQREQRVVEAHLVSMSEGHHFLRLEFLEPGAALSQLQDCLPKVLPHHRVHETRVLTETEGRVDTDLDPKHAETYRACLWDAASACIESAGKKPITFLLAGGRQRTATAYMTTLFQLLARSEDQLLDVRVDDPRVEGGTGFFFPEQPQRRIAPDIVGRGLRSILAAMGAQDSAQNFLRRRIAELETLASQMGGSVDASQVGVHLVDVPVPRLRGIVPKDALATFEGAIGGVGHALEPYPELRIDLSTGRVTVDEKPIALSVSCKLWLTGLALQRLDPDSDDGWLPVADLGRFKDLLGNVSALGWVELPDASIIASVLGIQGYVGPTTDTFEAEGEKLKKVRADTRARMKKWVSHPGRERWAKWLVPETISREGTGFQRLALPGAFIKVFRAGTLPRPGEPPPQR